MTERVFRRKSDAGHQSIFKSRVTGPYITVEIVAAYDERAKFVTTLNKEDARRYAEWLLEKTK